MNQGMWFEQICHDMVQIYPDKFEKHDYLKPVYGCYKFAIHAVYRLYHGWYNSGNPTDLFPVKSEEIAGELIKLTPPEKYIEHCRKLVEEGKLQLALHIIDPVVLGVNQEESEVLLEALQLKYSILRKQAEQEPSFITSNINNNEIINLEGRITELKKSV